MRKHSAAFFLFIVLFAVCCACGKDTTRNTADKIIVAVSIVPQETFVKEVAGEDAEVIVLIPPGYSPENYDPSPALISALSEASVFFTMGLPAESSIISRIKSMNSKLGIVRLEDEVGKIYPHRYFDEHQGHHHIHDGRDPHIWLSPKRVMVMVDVIAQKLSELNPGRAEAYANNAEAFKEKLSQLDQSIEDLLKDIENRQFIMYHPSLGYFADQYGLKMHALEKTGKEPSAKEMRELVDFARQNGIKAVLYQAETDSSVTEAFASEIGGSSVCVDPLSADYINNLFAIAETIHDILKDGGG